MPAKFIRSLALFGREVVQNPGPMGAAFPSSPALAREMARLAHDVDGLSGHVVELGAGTGAITAAILEAKVPEERLIALERSPTLAAALQKRFPKLRVLTGDACDLNRLLRQHVGGTSPRISAVISSLPLRSIPCRKVARLILEVRRLLGEGGVLVQYTYAVHRRTRFPECFEKTGASLVLLNLPPARVERFSVRASR
jgi:phospholipid N-methyltransferase